jgi:hypothetical protein
VYEGGYMANFYKSSSALARQWSQTSSGEYLGLYPAYTLGALTDRNRAAVRNFSALTSLPRRRDPTEGRLGYFRPGNVTALSGGGTAGSSPAEKGDSTTSCHVIIRDSPAPSA